MFKQNSRFQKEEDNHVDKTCFHSNIQVSGFDYEEVNIGDITFKAGQSESVHRWYRLTPSFSPNLVRYLIQELGIDEKSFVLDPFSGRGTTIIECQKKGIPALGIEINPLLREVGDKSLNWERKSLDLFDVYVREAAELINTYGNETLETVLEKFETRLPIIHNVFRWWKESVLRDLILCRQLMMNEKYSPVYDYLWLAINKASLDCANIHRNHPTITFDDNHKRNIDVYLEVTGNLKSIKSDLEKLSENEISFSKQNAVALGNSTENLRDLVNRPIECVITSPPYPNRYSYVHQTRPQLHFMELLDDVKQATELDLMAIGGTWGRATSILQSQLITVPDEIKPYLSYYDELQDKSILMCNYATKYFIDMWKHIKSVKEFSAENFRAAYVVGNSRLSGIEIFTEVILGKIFEHEDFRVEKIISFRKRGGKRKLYETAVCI
ncbi:MAG TPA: DNA methyltransferase [Pyrinomonadaceae bacterium]|nr:DNA methyltransferase [Pyrinomonadaceae bacterium]